MDTLWSRGGFTESFLAAEERRSFQWHTQFIQTCLERNVPMLGPRIPAHTLHRFWQMRWHIVKANCSMRHCWHKPTASADKPWPDTWSFIPERKSSIWITARKPCRWRSFLKSFPDFDRRHFSYIHIVP